MNSETKTEAEQMRKFLTDTARIVNSLSNRLRMIEYKLERMDEKLQTKQDKPEIATTIYDSNKTIRMRVNH